MGLTIGLLIMIALLLAFNYWILSNVIDSAIKY